jgi:hypothetical protein
VRLLYRRLGPLAAAGVRLRQTLRLRPARPRSPSRLSAAVSAMTRASDAAGNHERVQCRTAHSSGAAPKPGSVAASNQARRPRQHLRSSHSPLHLAHVFKILDRYTNRSGGEEGVSAAHVFKSLDRCTKRSGEMGRREGREWEMGRRERCTLAWRAIFRTLFGYRTETSHDGRMFA